MPRMQRYATGVPCWVDLQTTDVDAAADFYTAIFGWESDGGAGSESSGYQLFSKNGAAVAAAGPQPPEIPRRRTLARFLSSPLRGPATVAA